MMKEFSPTKIIAPFSLLALTVLGGCQAALVDAYPILVQKCEADDVIIVNGVPVASATFILDNGQRVAVGGAPLLDHNIVTGEGNGDLSIQHARSKTPAILSHDGRFIVENIKPGLNDILAISASPLGDHTEIIVTMDCMDSRLRPPIVRKRRGFSPSKKSKESPSAYNGLPFGRKT